MRIERLSTPSGLDTLRVNGHYFHSRHDPLKEARRVAAQAEKAGVAFVLSPGLGYLLQEIPADIVIGIEKHDEIARAANKACWVGLSAEQIYERCLEDPYRMRDRVVIMSGAMLDEDAEYYSAARRAIQRALDKVVEEVVTVDRFHDLWESNLSSNKALFSEAKWICEFRPRCAGRTVVIFAAGPTLEEDAARFAMLTPDAVRAGIVTIAVDSALPAVRRAGIIPDFCITLDPQPLKLLSLRDLDHVPLIASVLSPPEITQMPSQLIFYGQGHPSEARAGIDPANTLSDTGGSVATAATGLALYGRAGRIILVGQDLAMVDDRMYAPGAPRYLAWLSRLDRFTTLEELMERDARLRKIRKAPGVAGGEVWTTPALDSYRYHFQNLARKYPEVEFVQTSRKGAKIGGFKQIGIDEAVKKQALSADKKT